MRRRLIGITNIKISLIQLLDTKAGDAVFYDTVSKAFVYYRFGIGEDEIPETHVPVGIIVIPPSHKVYEDGAAGVLSLKEMSPNNPDIGNIKTQYVYWGGNGQENAVIKNHNEICYVGENGTINKDVKGISTYAYLPSDSYTFLPNKYDTITQYYNSEKYAPSPYNNDGSRNSSYYQIAPLSSVNNMLSDFNGKTNTSYLLEYVSGQKTWKTDDVILNYHYIGYHPAACCCWRYHTMGTSQGDWYLPAIGELGYIVPRLSAINKTIDILITLYDDTIAVPVSDNIYLSSSEFDVNHSIIVNTGNGKVSQGSKNSSYYARAFSQIGGGRERTFGDVLISGGTVADIEARGGTSKVIGYTYSQTYGYNGETTGGGIITSGALIEETKITANQIGAFEKERTKIGTCELSITMNGKTTIQTYDVYQEANIKEYVDTIGGEMEYGEVVPGEVVHGHIPAYGGTAIATAGNGTQGWTKSPVMNNYKFTSDILISEEIEPEKSGVNEVAPSVSEFSADAISKYKTPSGETVVDSKKVVWVGENDKSASDILYIYQDPNEVTETYIESVKTYTAIKDDPDMINGYIPASGGIATAIAPEVIVDWSKTATFKIYEYSSKEYDEEIFEPASSGSETITPTLTYIYGREYVTEITDNTITAQVGSKGIIPSDRTTVCEYAVYYDFKNLGWRTTYLRIYQDANIRTEVSREGGEIVYGKAEIPTIEHGTIPASGGTAAAYVSNGYIPWTKSAEKIVYSYTSGAPDYEEVNPAEEGVNEVFPEFVESSMTGNIIEIGSNGFTAQADSKGTTISDYNSVASITVRFNGIGNTTLHVYQDANKKVKVGELPSEMIYGPITPGNLIWTTGPDETIPATNIIPASGGAVTVTATPGAQTWHKTKPQIVYEYTSGEPEYEEYGESDNGIYTNIRVTPSNYTFEIGSKGIEPSDKTLVGEQVFVWESRHDVSTVEQTAVCYQEANVKELIGTGDGEIVYGEVIPGEITKKVNGVIYNGDFPAEGCSYEINFGNGSQSWSKSSGINIYEFSSGEIVEEEISEPVIGENTVKPQTERIVGALKSKGTTPSDRSLVHTYSSIWTGNDGKEATNSLDIYQEANVVKSIKFLCDFCTHAISRNGGILELLNDEAQATFTSKSVLNIRNEVDITTGTQYPSGEWFKFETIGEKKYIIISENTGSQRYVFYKVSVDIEGETYYSADYGYSYSINQMPNDSKQENYFKINKLSEYQFQIEFDQAVTRDLNCILSSTYIDPETSKDVLYVTQCSINNGSKSIICEVPGAQMNNYTFKNNKIVINPYYDDNYYYVYDYKLLTDY